MARNSATAAALKLVRSTPICSHIYKAFAGYYLPFSSLEEAREAIGALANRGHAHPYAVDRHMEYSQAARPSDYAALYYIRPLVEKLRTVIDVGGNAGNLFYCYSKYLHFRSDLIWKVLDLPEVISRGRALAIRCGASQLNFVESWSEASGADLLIASGSLHYFEPTLPRLLADVSSLPRHLLINRTPLVDGAKVAIVQDGGAYRVACVLHNRNALIMGLEKLGYRLIDAWPVAELSADLPGYPEYTVSGYSGMFFSHHTSS